MAFLLVDNSTNLEKAKMTPKIIEYFNQNKIKLIVCSNKTINQCNEENIIGIILSGSPIILSNSSLIEKYIINFNILIKYPNIPILGICFGFQLMCLAYGSKIGKLNKTKNGILETIQLNKNLNSVLYKDIQDRDIIVYQNHNDYIKKVPNNFIVTATNSDNIIQSVENKDILRFGTQFHPENSPTGKIILKNFVDFCLSKFNNRHS